jgi:arylsulfatase A-like enzyme
MYVVPRLRCSMLVVLVSSAVFACSERPNIILVSIDTLRADHVGCYGYAKATSPNIDRIAGEGALFETVIADSSWTLPAHMSMLTGLTSMVHGVQHEGLGLDPKRRTLAQILQGAGYRTIGIYSAPYLHPLFGFDRGFDSYESVVDWKAFDDASLSLADPNFEQKLLLHQQEIASHAEITSPKIVERAKQRIAEHRGQPFFLFLHFFDVHADYIPPDEDWRPFDPDYTGTIDGRRFSENSAFRAGMDRRDYDHVLALYDGEIHYVDRHLQMFLARLHELDLDRNTLLVITADHGEEFLEHGYKSHRYTLFEEVLDVPLIFRFPGVIEGRRRFPQLVRQIDIMPTILSLVGIRPPPEVMGRDLGPLLRGEKGTLEELPAVSRLMWPGAFYASAIRIRNEKYLAIHRVGAPPSPLPWRPEELGTTLDPKLLSAKDALERFTAGERAALDRLERSPDTRVDLPSDLKDQLRSLGYVETGSGADNPSAAQDVGQRLELYFDLAADPKEQRPLRDGRAPN